MSPPSPAAGIRSIATEAKRASRILSSIPTAQKNAALLGIASALERVSPAIMAANSADVTEAKAAAGPRRLSEPLIDRIRLDAEKLAMMIASVRAVAELDDPVGRILMRTMLDSRLELHKVSCPLGVIAVIFEARPDAVTQISALALKSGNSVVLKGGHEARRTVGAIVGCIRSSLGSITGIPEASVCAVAGREAVEILLSLNGVVDLVIPRGTSALVRHVQSHTTIPVLGHTEGVCHIYIDALAASEMVLRLVLDSKLQYPAACNAVETVLIHTAAISRVLAPLLENLRQRSVEVRACPRVMALSAPGLVVPAVEEDWSTEHGGLVLGIKIVDDLEDAIAHINERGSSHTDAILTSDEAAAARFLDGVDSASVMHNASTRFADGYRYGLGAEVGISTSKLHARGPVGLEGLTTYKYKLYGNGHVVAD